MRRNKTVPTEVGLDDLLGWAATEPATPVTGRDKRRAVLTGIAASTFLGVLVSLLALPWIGAGAITTREAVEFYNNLPSKLPEQALPQRSVILAADGTKIGQFFSENRVVVASHDIPQVVRDAVVDIEDSRFYEHSGIDTRGTARALVNNLLSDSTQGGSTLTQQYVKQVLANAATSEAEYQAVTSRTSYMRKLREAKYAIELEKTRPKDDILTAYLNIAYFGDGAYGIGTAARHYFNTNVADLTVPQAALLAGLVKNPTGYDPTDNAEAAKSRRNTVLFRMHQLGHITDRQYNRATTSPIRLNVVKEKNGCTQSRYPFFCQYVREQLQNNPVFGDTEAARQQRLYAGGMTITTTLDPSAQDASQEAVDAALGRDNRIAANAVTVQPGTGHIVSMAVNRTFGTSKPGHFDKTEMILPALPSYQPGSNFKPFTLAAALERGFNPNTVMYAPPVYAPAGMNYPGSGFQNSGSSASGNFNAAQAIWRSSNTWFIKLQEQVGVRNVASMAQRLGITSMPMEGENAIGPRDASLTLGAYETSPLQMAGAYATFAASGVHCEPIAITSITNAAGKNVEVPDANCHEAIPASVADTIANIMTGTIDGPDSARTGKAMTIGRPAAGKTGTTQNNSAVWFSGYTPQYATSIEVSDPRGGFKYPLRNFYANGEWIASAYGGTVAGPIWKNIMADLHTGQPVQRFPQPGAITGYGSVVPDVRGLTLPQAYQALVKAGFKVTLSSKTAAKDAILPADRVYSTSPASGSPVGTGTTVAITMTARSNLHVNLDTQ